MTDKAYEEIGRNYRFFLAWRHAAFAAGLVIIWGTCSLVTSAYEKQMGIAWMIPISASLPIFCLWVADKRTRQIYRSLLEAGKALESSDRGSYHALSEISVSTNPAGAPHQGNPPGSLFSHSFALDCFFLGTTVVLLVVAAILLLRPSNVAPTGDSMPEMTASGQFW